MRNRKIKQVISLFCALIISSSVIPLEIFAAEDAVHELYSVNSYSADTLDFTEYYEKYKNAARPDREITLDAEAFKSENGQVKRYSDYEGMAGISLQIGEKDSVSGIIEVPETGNYNLKFSYFPISGQGSPIQLDVLLDGVIPFNECSALTFERIWNNANSKLEYDIQGNEIMPQQVETPEWRVKTAADDTGYVSCALSFYLTAGRHTLTIKGRRDTLLLRSISFYKEEDLPSYKELSAEYEKAGYKSVSSSSAIIIEAENASAKSDQMLYALCDRSSPTVTPYNAAKNRYNTIGGDQWKTAGQWIEWTVNIKETGLYTIAAHFKQSLKSGNVSVRELYIDEKLPFKEAADISFKYDGGWQNQAFSDNSGKPYRFYLTKGEHKIKLKVGLGSNSEILSKARSLLEDLNRVYREIVVVTGANPDVYRSYNLPTLIPETLESMKQISKKLKALEKEIAKLSTGKNSADIKRIYIQLDAMTEDSDTVAKRLTGFKDNVSSFGTWINNGTEQPLELDKLMLNPINAKLEKGEAGFFSLAKHYMVQFFWSFVTDYSAVGKTDTDATTEITIWQTSGRDQAQVLKSQINSDFTPESGIAVVQELVSPNALLSAILAGIGPDVCLGVAQTEPMNLALRNAIVDFNRFEDLEELTSQFKPDTLESFYFNGGLYALPETISYPMLFYRKDILAELDIDIASLEEWETILQNVLPTLKKASLSFGILPSLNNYLMFLYQRGGRLYEDNNRISSLASAEAISAMEQYSMLYTQYGISLAFDFANRFRSGEVPIAVAEFTAYNQLTVFAPEIKGLWGMLPVPGTKQVDGRVCHASAATLTGDIILAQSDEIDASWKFIKWWLSSGTQSNYGKAIESIVGSAARYNSANYDAFSTVQWDADVKQNLMAQLEFVRATPEVPGGYYTTRSYDFAFRDIVYSADDVRETMIDTAEDINREMQTKRDEYGLE